MSASCRDWRNAPSPDDAPFKILIKRGAFTDAARGGRQVPFKLYYPVEHGLPSLPAIIWSHGLGGSADGAAFLARYIAGQGYIVVNIQHQGTDSSLWEGKPGHPWDVIRAAPIPPATVIDRFRDVPFVLDSLPGWAAEHPEIGGVLDMSRLGMSGHSFGALTTQVMAGQGYPAQDGGIFRLAEDRFRAGILYSPVPVAPPAGVAEEALYASISLPLLHMTGTLDVSPIEGFGVDRRLEVYEHAGGGEQDLLVLKDGDHMVFAGSRGKLEDSPHRLRHETIIKLASLAFWDAHLAQNAAAGRWLAGGGLARFAGTDAAYQRRA